MSEFCITYGTIQAHPRLRHRLTVDERTTLVLAAENVPEAYAAAYDHLTRKGLRVRRVGDTAFALQAIQPNQWREIHARGVPESVREFGAIGDTGIIEITRHNIEHSAKILSC